MKKILLFIGMLFLILGVTFYFINKDKKLTPEDSFYKISSRFFDSYNLQQEFYNNVNTLFIKDTIYCSVNENLQEKVNQAIGKTLILNEGIHKSYVLKLPSNIKIVIPKKASIKLADDFVINQSAYGDAVGDAVIQCWGKEDKLLENIIIELNGTIDGNKSLHPYSQGGIEGVDFKWVKNSYIYGSGSIINANGDGLDINVSHNCYFEGITFLNNDGGGVHFGSPRPIKSSFNNLVVGCKAMQNGFLSKRYGFDHSWPNINGVTYFDCIAIDNFTNWGVEGSGGILLNCFSIYKDSIKKTDIHQETLFSDLSYTRVSDSKEVDSIKIKETGYYFVTSQNTAINNNYKYLVNGVEKNKIKITSFNHNKFSTAGIYFLHKNDIIEFNLLQDTSFSQNIKGLSKIKAIPIVDYESFYPYNYEYKIQKWKAKAKISIFISDVYAFFK